MSETILLGKKGHQTFKSKEFNEFPDKRTEGSKKGEAMVGFKFSSLIVFLSLLLVGCMPQNKQTDCKTNEAFSASLRSCVPIVPSVDSFINIRSFTPTYNISAYKNSMNNIQLVVDISDPYSQDYTLQWNRNYNGISYTFLDNDGDNKEKTRFFMPGLFSSQVGAHVITVQVLSLSGQVVDTHSWTITLTELPTPYLSAQLPSSAGLGDRTSSAATETFSINAVNNGGTIIPSTEIVWTLDSTVVQTCSVSNSCYQTGSSSTSITSYTTPAFNTMSIGNHTVSAVLRDATRIYAQFTWSFSVINPPKAKVEAIFARDGDSNSNNYTVIARTGVPYSNTYDNGLGGSFRNFFLTNNTQTSIYYDAGRANFCIQFERDHGSQLGSYVDVRFYLDGNASPVATVSTTLGDDKVCLSDAAAADLLNVIYNNANPNAEESHTLSARIFDQAIMGAGKEYTYGDFLAGSGTAVYPVAWTILVKPQNMAPEVSFGATQLSSVLASTPLACTSNAPTEKSGCEVYTDTNFRVSLLALRDDFFMPPYAAYADANFNYSLRLYRGGALVHTCTKTISGMDGSTDSSGPEFACSFNIPSFGALGPINTDLYAYHIEGEISDAGSPYSAYGAVAKTSQTFKWNLNVKETNNAPVIASISPASGVTLNEGATVDFHVTVEDLDRDNHTQRFFLCKQSQVADPTCSVNIPLHSLTQTSSRSSNALGVTTTSSITLPEDFLHQLDDLTLNCSTLSRGLTCAVRFNVEVSDGPFTPEIAETTSQIINYDIVNVNPAPQYNPANYAPLSLTGHDAVVGVPFVLNPGTITDASNALVLTERQTRFQWYSSIDNTTWSIIPDARSQLLNWTPASEIAASGDNVFLKLCMQDQPDYVVLTVNEEVCTNDLAHGGSGPWVIRSHRNYVALDGLANLPATKNQMAVWKGPEQTNTRTPTSQNVTPVYSVYVSASNTLVIEKSVLNSTGGYLASGHAPLVIDPRASGDMNAVTDIQDLSMTGTNSSLYITYRMATAATPSQYRFYIRRIDIGGPKTNIIFAENKSFGFSYSNPIVTTSAAPSEVTIGSFTPSPGVNYQTVEFITSATIAGPTVVASVAGVNFTAASLCPSGCSETAFASALISAINNSSNANLRGIYAEVHPSDSFTVLIKGAVTGDAYNDTLTSVGRMGQIYISGGSWHVIMINKSLTGGNTDKISVYSGPVDVKVTGTTPVLTRPIEQAVLGTIQASSFITNSPVFNESGTDYVIVGSIAVAGSTARAYKLHASAYSSALSSGPLFSSAATFDLKVAATNGVNRYFVLADAYDSIIGQRNFFFTKLDTILTDEITKTVSDPTFVDASTQALFDYNDVYDINLVAYTGGVARVFFITDHSSVPALFSASLMADFTLTCHSCNPISGSIEVSALSKIALSQIRLKNSCVAAGLTQAHCLIGSEGYDSTPGLSTDDSNYKDVIFAGYTVLENLPSDFQPAVGVFNLQSESIHSSSLDSTDGKFRPAFFAP